MEDEKKTGNQEQTSDFSYMTKLSEAYKRAFAERKPFALDKEKRLYLARMQRETEEIAKTLANYFEREEKKELALMLQKSANDAAMLLGECEAYEGEAEPPATSLLTRAVLLANRSLNALADERSCGKLYHCILSEISALYALAAIG